MTRNQRAQHAIMELRLHPTVLAPVHTKWQRLLETLAFSPTGHPIPSYLLNHAQTSDPQGAAGSCEVI